MYWNFSGWPLSTITGVDQLAPSSPDVDIYTAALRSSLGTRRCIQVAYNLPSSGSAVIFGVSLQRNPTCEPELNDMPWSNGTETMVPDTGKLPPPSAE